MYWKVAKNGLFSTKTVHYTESFLENFALIVKLDQVSCFIYYLLKNIKCHAKNLVLEHFVQVKSDGWTTGTKHEPVNILPSRSLYIMPRTN